MRKNSGIIVILFILGLATADLAAAASGLTRVPESAYTDKTLNKEEELKDVSIQAIASPSVLHHDNAAEEPYRLGCGDVIEISIWKDEALSKTLPILPDGTVFFPLVGKIDAAGKTVEELKKDLESGISKYVPDPFLHVGVVQTGSMMIYIIGKVNGPGRHAINSNINVLQALAMAGGLNPFAKKSKIRILRESGLKTEVFPFNYETAVDGSNLIQNIELMRGDIVVIP